MFTPYTAQSLSVAYQLRWSLAIFPDASLSGPFDWVQELSQACEPDGIRVLEATTSDRGTLLLLVSTQPHVAPKFIVQRVKGRLQHLLNKRTRFTCRRNFQLTTVGDAKIDRVNQYVAAQLEHHQMGSQAAQENLAELQWQDDKLDITKPIQSAHGRYALGLHVVLVHAQRWCQAELDFVELTRNTIRGVLADADSPAGRISPLADHVHFTLRLHYEASPSDLIVRVMNEVCQAHRNQRMWMDGYYVGSVGAYDMAAVRRAAPPSSPRWSDD